MCAWGSKMRMASASRHGALERGTDVGTILPRDALAREDGEIGTPERRQRLGGREPKAGVAVLEAADDARDRARGRRPGGHPERVAPDRAAGRLPLAREVEQHPRQVVAGPLAHA